MWVISNDDVFYRYVNMFVNLASDSINIRIVVLKNAEFWISIQSLWSVDMAISADILCERVKIKLRILCNLVFVVSEYHYGSIKEHGWYEDM